MPLESNEHHRPKRPMGRRKSWSEAHDAYEEGSPAEHAIEAVAERHDLAREHLRSSVIRATDDGMTVVVESDG